MMRLVSKTTEDAWYVTTVNEASVHEGPSNNEPSCLSENHRKGTRNENICHPES